MKRILQGAPARYRVTEVKGISSREFARCIVEVLEPGTYTTLRKTFWTIRVRILSGGPREWQGKAVILQNVNLRKLRSRKGTTCTCIAYAWPHRRGAGLCNES